MPKAISFSRQDWEEICYAVDSKVKAIEGGFYGYEDPEGDDEEWVEQLRNIFNIINSVLESDGEVDVSVFSEKDWAEIYYSLDSKINGIKKGFFGPEDKPGENKEWIAQLKKCAKAIAKHHDV